MMYPKLVIYTNEIIENAKHMVKLAKENHIDFVMGVVKVLAGHMDFMEEFAQSGITHIADSRIQNLKKLQKIPLPKVLLRLPMISEVDFVIELADISLNSELSTIVALNKAAIKQNKKHQIILMFDLGDLREGIYYQSDYLEIVKEILSLSHIELLGIGTNLTCYGGVIPNKAILNRLIQIKESIEKTFNYQLKIVSGGNSSTVTLFDKTIIPRGINSLRLGESIFFGNETSYSNLLEGFHHDNFILQAEVIECQTKPSFPDGISTINSFGEQVNIEDKGLMQRAILAIGKQDVMFKNLKPVDEYVEIIGGSSDHLIIDITGTHYEVGDIVSFKVNYPGLLHLMNSRYVYKLFKKNKAL